LAPSTPKKGNSKGLHFPSLFASIWQELINAMHYRVEAATEHNSLPEKNWNECTKTEAAFDLSLQTA